MSKNGKCIKIIGKDIALEYLMPKKWFGGIRMFSLPTALVFEKSGEIPLVAQDGFVYKYDEERTGWKHVLTENPYVELIKSARERLSQAYENMAQKTLYCAILKFSTTAMGASRSAN
ncbi:MAG: hypothetical protein LBO03_07860 [Acidaminococcales bacterium]|nr:hypothetical protein [Acidaminococcales bacterium]